MGIKKLSKNDQHVLDVLLQAQKPLSAYELLDKLRRFGVRSPPTVYRALEALIDQELVHRVESLNAFVACSCSHDHCAGGALAICTSCGGVEELEEEKVKKDLRKKGSGFLKQVNREVVEISGICHACCRKSEKGK